jgi:hypothetical protein
MKSWTAWSALALLSSCGRTGHNGDSPAGDNSAGAAAGGTDSSPPGVGPIDASGQPEALPMTCEGRAQSLAFKLPCLVGQNLSGQLDEPGYHVVECELAGMPDQTAVSFIVPLKQLPELLNQPVSIPFDGIPGPPPSSGVALDAEHFAGALSGVVTFSQVDVDGRAFVARLEQGHVVWSGDQGSKFACSTLDGPFWASAGSFI